MFTILHFTHSAVFFCLFFCFCLFVCFCFQVKQNIPQLKPEVHPQLVQKVAYATSFPHLHQLPVAYKCSVAHFVASAFWLGRFPKWVSLSRPLSSLNVIRGQQTFALAPAATFGLASVSYAGNNSVSSL